MVRRRLCLMVTCVALVLAGCSGNTDETSGSGPLPVPSEPDTLLPVPDDTQPPDVTESLPPDALFGGDLCTALTDADLPGVIVDSGALSADSCQYLLKVGGREVEVVVQVQSPSDFLNPGITDEAVDELDGPGLAARGVTHTTADGEEYEVIVKVENGFFSVTAPDRATAERLAAAAEPRATP